VSLGPTPSVRSSGAREMCGIDHTTLRFVREDYGGDRREGDVGWAGPRDRSPGVNTNTVLRSMRLPQDEGLLELRRGRGITVAGTPERGVVMQKVRELVEFARGQGYAVDELVEMIEDVA